jgi:hypothetical protein
LLNKTERIDAPPQMNPFARAQREAKPEKQAELIQFAQRSFGGLNARRPQPGNFLTIITDGARFPDTMAA